MKVLAIQGSPRKNGNTDVVLDRVLNALHDTEQADVEKLYARSLDVSGCIECFACQKVRDVPGCSIKDNMVEVYDKMLSADLIVIASPVFCWGFTAQLKAILDRLYATFKFDEDPYVSMLDGKRVALIVTAGGGRDDGASACEECYQKLFAFARAQDCGALIVPSLTEPSDTRSDEALMKRADAFAADLAKQLG